MVSATATAAEPGALTSFVGRDEALREAAEAIADARLVTIVGPGGVGKTRFAWQLLYAAGDGFEGQPIFVDLSPVHSGDRVGAEILAALGGQLRQGSEIEAAASLIGDRRLLLALDNCEQVIDGAGHAVQRLLLTCPALHILATSREPLAVPGEAIFRLPPLPLPGSGATLSAETAGNPCLELFLDRARAVERGFVLTGDNIQAVISICRAVDGIPLAVELAAARVRTLPVDQLAKRLERGLGALSGGPRAAPERHRTMHASIASSVEPLPVAERALFRRLAIFTGGWTLEAAEGVCAGGAVRPDAVLDLLESLADRSLLVPATDGGRFRLLAPILEFAREELLDSDETAAVGAAHCRWFRQLAARAAPHLNTRAEPYWLEVLSADNDNLRSALAWAATHAEQFDDGLFMAGDLLWFWNLRGLAAEAYRTTTHLLASPFRCSPRARMAALQAHSMGAAFVGEPVEAEAAAGEAHGIARELDDPLQLARTAFFWANALRDQGNRERARPHLEEAVARANEAGTRFEAAMPLFMLAFGEPDPLKRQAQLERGTSLMAELGGSFGLAAASIHRGELARVAGDLDTAELEHRDAVDHANRIGNLRMACIATLNLGLVSLQRGDVKSATPLAREALELALRIGQARVYQATLLAATCAEAITGDAAQAARWLACADAPEPCPIQPEDYPVRDLAYGAARRRLGGRFEEEFRRGLGARPEDVAREALAVLSASGAPAARPAGAAGGVSLSAREQEVLRLVAAGTSNREIAEQLVLSTRTVETHIANTYSKIGVQNRVEATRWAVDAGLAAQN